MFGRLTEMGLDELDVVDSRKPSDNRNYITSISKLEAHFKG